MTVRLAFSPPEELLPGGVEHIISTCLRARKAASRDRILELALLAALTILQMMLVREQIAE
jgi:hypothetical protein